MTAIIVIIFIIGYLMIALEHPLKIDKTASALFTGMVVWAIYALWGDSITTFETSAISYIQEHGLHHFIDHELMHHLFDISNILFFLLGAMTIVETIDIHDGFHIITSRITTTNKVKLLWIICIITFFLSAVLDNLTTSIVMVSLLIKLIPDRKTRLLYSSMVIIAANAGGAWSPIGDITTTMLWIGGQITTANIIQYLILPSFVCMVVPLLIVSRDKSMRGNFEPRKTTETLKTTAFERQIVLILGVGALLNVPVFKTLTHLPPFMGMLFGLGVLWIATEVIHSSKDIVVRKNMSVIHALTRVDAPSVLFFLGILMAVSCLQSIGVLRNLAEFLDNSIGNYDIIVMAIGVLSSIVDNVPLVAASMGMYDVVSPQSLQAATSPEQIEALSYFVQDGKFWEFLAFCAGTGGSLLVIGSAAGVAVMGIERIDFIWYLKKISWLALVGYIAGCLVYILQEHLLM
ncbi:MAG: sodium:proton antiporter NhaD [Bacteroidetes bacterium]|nr:sodium:proton antiporter NhaD [Bacteroidota bacterium]MCB9043801.1 sodium:proton antiporter NhaD [Chitinophagales bacterium]